MSQPLLHLGNVDIVRERGRWMVGVPLYGVVRRPASSSPSPTIAAATPTTKSQMVRSLGAPVNSADKREPTEAEACIPKMISTTPTTSKAIPTTLCMPLSSCTLLQGCAKKLADFSGWYRRRFPLFFCARSILHLPCRTLLRSALPAVIEPRRGHRSVSQPLLHTRQTQPQPPARASSSPSAHPGTGLNYGEA